MTKRMLNDVAFVAEEPPLKRSRKDDILSSLGCGSKRKWFCSHNDNGKNKEEPEMPCKKRPRTAISSPVSQTNIVKKCWNFLCDKLCCYKWKRKCMITMTASQATQTNENDTDWEWNTMEQDFDLTVPSKCDSNVINKENAINLNDYDDTTLIKLANENENASFSVTIGELKLLPILKSKIEKNGNKYLKIEECADGSKYKLIFKFSNVNWKLYHLSCLIDCIKNGKITESGKWDVNELELLLECDKFFAECDKMTLIDSKMIQKMFCGEGDFDLNKIIGQTKNRKIRLGACMAQKKRINCAIALMSYILESAGSNFTSQEWIPCELNPKCGYTIELARINTRLFNTRTRSCQTNTKDLYWNGVESGIINHTKESNFNGNSIQVRINNTSDIFDLNDLKLVTYFDALLSNRWNNNNNNNTKHVSIDGLSTFNVIHLKYLINCIKHGCPAILDNMAFNGSFLSSLVTCDEYFMNKNVITVDYLCEYLYLCEPGFDYSKEYKNHWQLQYNKSKYMIDSKLRMAMIKFENDKQWDMNEYFLKYYNEGFWDMHQYHIECRQAQMDKEKQSIKYTMRHPIKRIKTWWSQCCDYFNMGNKALSIYDEMWFSIFECALPAMNREMSLYFLGNWQPQIFCIQI